MRVLMATDSYPPDVSGSSVFARRLACGLAGLGHDVHVVCASDTGPDKVVLDEGVQLHRLGSLPLLIYPSLRFTSPVGIRRRLRHLMDDLRPGVVHAQDHFTIGRAAIGAAVEYGVPVVATNHFMPENLTPYVPKPLRPLVTRIAWHDFQKVYDEADRLTAPTPAAAALIQRHGLHRSVEPVSCGVDLEEFHPREPPAVCRRALGIPDLPTIGYVGRLDTDKHLEDPLRASTRLGGSDPVQLVVAGSGARRGRLERLSDRLGVTDRVHFVGYVADDRLRELYAAFDVFCLPGTAELQSIATLEALATGIPVVLADAVALPHLVRPGANGFLYPPGDIDALAAALSRALSADRRTMGIVSRRIAEQHSAARTIARFDEIYRQLECS